MQAVIHVLRMLLSPPECILAQSANPHPNNPCGEIYGIVNGDGTTPQLQLVLNVQFARERGCLGASATNLLLLLLQHNKQVTQVTCIKMLKFHREFAFI